MNLFAIPPHVPFLDAVAADWLDRAATPLAVADGLILLPTRRAARSLADAFLRVSGGQALLLPRIMALGALDEAPLALAGALDLPPAVEPAQRLAVLTQMILGLQGHHGAPRTADRAWPLAVELAALMDEAERSDIDLAARLPDAADDRFAAHWAETLTFLAIVTHAWPAWLAEQGLMNPAARQVALLDAQAEAWRAAPPARARAVGRHHRRNSRRGATGAGDRRAADRRGGAAGAGHRHDLTWRGERCPIRTRRPGCDACWTDSAGLAATFSPSLRGRGRVLFHPRAPPPSAVPCCRARR